MVNYVLKYFLHEAIYYSVSILSQPRKKVHSQYTFLPCLYFYYPGLREHFISIICGKPRSSLQNMRFIWPGTCQWLSVGAIFPANVLSR